MHSQINFGYPWPIGYAHLILAAVLLAILGLGWVFHWRKPLLVLLGLASVWALAAWTIVRFAIDINGRATLPTQAFLPSGAGQVLDMGAGTGRSTLMVLEARPRATVVSLDLFGASYEQHFGQPPAGESTVDEGRAALMRNLRAAGVQQRATIQPGDMRHMPLDSDSFDAVVSAYAIDHLSGDGITQALGEANRVLKPGGQFLLIVLAKDFWLQFTFGPLVAHSHMIAANFWDRKLRDAGFTILEDGTQPATKFVLARKDTGHPRMPL
ncbi:MAG TPA: class I SAM-dependent methyltransferase [Bryobacteraceae bacterium]|nr:class I SAM-dependent methyltransferase [Bryobacteraceae bacterium]